MALADKFDLGFVGRLMRSRHGTVAGTLGDLLKSPKVRDLYREALGVPVMAIGTAVQKGKPVGSPDPNVRFFGAFGSFRGEPCIFVNPRWGEEETVRTLLEEGAHAMRGLRGRPSAKQDITGITGESIGEHHGLPEEMSARRMVDYALSLGESGNPLLRRKADYSPDAMDAYGYAQSDAAVEILREYKQHLGQKRYRQRWEVVPAARLVKIWTDYARTGFVRDEKGMDEIARILVQNVAKLDVNTILCGHTPLDPVEWAKDWMDEGEELPENYFEVNESFFDDEHGSWRLSDYALNPLQDLAMRLLEAETAEQKFVVADRLLNVVHQRSDLAGWFVQGGQRMLSRLAGTPQKAESKKIKDFRKKWDKRPDEGLGPPEERREYRDERGRWWFTPPGKSSSLRPKTTLLRRKADAESEGMVTLYHKARPGREASIDLHGLRSGEGGGELWFTDDPDLYYPESPNAVYSIRVPEAEAEAARVGGHDFRFFGRSWGPGEIAKARPGRKSAAKRLPPQYVYHNTTPEALEAIEREGLTGGSFSDRPIDFGGTVWIAVRKDDLPPCREHRYGGSIAYEPAWESGQDEKGFSITRTVPPGKVVQVDGKGNVVGQLGGTEVAATGSSKPVALPEANGVRQEVFQGVRPGQSSPYWTPDREAAEAYARRVGGEVRSAAMDQSRQLDLSMLGVACDAGLLVAALYKAKVLKDIEPGQERERAMIGLPKGDAYVAVWRVLERPEVRRAILGAGYDSVRFRDEATNTGYAMPGRKEHEAILVLAGRGEPNATEVASGDAKGKVAARRGIWFHGSSIKNLESILHQGLIPELPDPGKRNWAEDPEASTYAPSRESYGGVYTSRNLMTALSSPKDHVEEGRETLVAMDLQPSTFYMDEDALQFYLSDVLGNLNDIAYYDFLYYFASALPGASETWKEEAEDRKAKYVEGVIHGWRQVWGGGNALHPGLEERLRQLLPGVWLAGVARLAAHMGAKLDQGMGPEAESRASYYRTDLFKAWHEVMPGAGSEDYDKAMGLAKATLPTVQEGEARYREEATKATKAMRVFARPKAGPSQYGRETARVATPIGYSGSNRIVAVAEVRDGRKYRSDGKGGWDFNVPVKITIHWGELPPEFFRQWESSYGSPYVVERAAEPGKVYDSGFQRLWQPAQAVAAAEAKVDAKSLAVLRRIRREARMGMGKLETGHSFCGHVALKAEEILGWPSVQGFYRFGGKRYLHIWNLLPDGTVVDGTHDQFGPPDILVIRPGQPGYGDYHLNCYFEKPEEEADKCPICGNPGTGKAAALAGASFPQSPQFKAWFAGSKVVDGQGNPLRVYHGTRSSTEFEEFSVSGPPVTMEGEYTSSGSGPDPTAFLGAHFAVDPSVAGQFAMGTGWQRSRYEAGEEKPRIIPVYLSIKNPKDFGPERNLRSFIFQGKITGYPEDLLQEAMIADGVRLDPDEGGEEADAWWRKYDSDHAFREEQNGWLFERYRTEEGDEDLLGDAARDLAEQARGRLEGMGHDGIRYRNEVEGGIAWIAFRPEQVKSAYATEFDPGKAQFTASERPKASGEDVLRYLMRLNEWGRETALQVLTVDGYGSEYELRDFPLSRLKPGDDWDPERAKELAALPTPFPPIILGYDWTWDWPRRRKLVVRDGNHRVDAAKRRGDRTIRAYVPVSGGRTASGSYSSRSLKG